MPRRDPEIGSSQDLAPSSPVPTQKRPAKVGWKGILLMGLVLTGGFFVVARLIQSSAEADADSQSRISVVQTSPGQPGDESQQRTDPLSQPPAEEADGILGELTATAIASAEHPFDPLLSVARTCLEKIDREIADYTATLTSQVRIDGKLLPEKQLTVKIRHPRKTGDDLAPFSVYTLFLAPESNKGQEAIWVDGWNQGNLVAHLAGIANIKRFYLNPESSHAMAGNRYPIWEIGFRNLIVKMVDVGEQDRKYGECEVTVNRNLEINGRPCTLLEAKHPIQREHFEFHIARIYIDNEREIPVAYEGYLWPETAGGEPILLEKYYYTDVKLNNELQDFDFDPANPEYHYPVW